MQQNNPSMVIGVTGITGSGTSTVAKMLVAHEGFVVEADKLAHELMLKGQPAYNEIVKIFGGDVLNADSEIDRRVLGGLVFGDVKQMAKLESIIHPLVIARTVEMIVASTHPFAVIDAPLLIESGMNKHCTSTWLITAPDSTRLARIQSRDHLTLDAATRRLNSRAGDDALRPHADVIIENNSSFADLTEKVNDALSAAWKEFTRI